MSDDALILLVDDFEDALDMYCEYLRFRGYRVVVAKDGEEAVTLARVHRPDLILLDLRMPGLSGLDVVRILRSDDASDGCPIVALTAHALDDERADVFRAGFDEVIAKPCLPDALVHSVERLLRDRLLDPLVLVATDIDDHAPAHASALSRNGFRAHIAGRYQESRSSQRGDASRSPLAM